MDQRLKLEFDSQGFVQATGFASPSLVAEIKRNLDRVISEVVPGMPREHVFYEDISDTNTLKQLQLLQEHDHFFSDLMSRGPFVRLAEFLLGSNVVCRNLQYFNKPAGIGSSTPAHQDGFYFKLTPCEAITLWLALDDVDEENGCIRYVSGSHRSGMRPHGTTGTLGFSQGISDFPNELDLENELAFPAQPGDLLAHHALTIHRADANQSSIRSRRSLGFIYYSAQAKQDSLAWERYQSELNEDLRTQGKI